ncbi:MAG: hypothetical protein B7Z55_03910, partial [Planctomycetales bacterium 12-60-4]
MIALCIWSIAIYGLLAAIAAGYYAATHGLESIHLQSTIAGASAVMGQFCFFHMILVIASQVAGYLNDLRWQENNLALAQLETDCRMLGPFTQVFWQVLDRNFRGPIGSFPLIFNCVVAA